MRYSGAGILPWGQFRQYRLNHKTQQGLVVYSFLTPEMIQNSELFRPRNTSPTIIDLTAQTGCKQRPPLRKYSLCFARSPTKCRHPQRDSVVCTGIRYPGNGLSAQYPRSARRSRPATPRALSRRCSGDRQCVRTRRCSCRSAG